MIKEEEIKSIIFITITGKNQNLIKNFYENFEEMIVHSDLPINVALHETYPLVLYSSASALSALKVVFRLQAMFEEIKMCYDVAENVDVNVKVFNVNDMASIDLK